MAMAKLYLRNRTAEGKQSPYRPALYDAKKRLRPGWCVVNGKEEHHPQAVYSERYKDENRKWRWRSHGNGDPHKADGKTAAATIREKLIEPKTEPAPEKARAVRIDDAIAAYVVKIPKPDKNGEYRPNKSIRSAKSGLGRFLAWSGKTFVKEVTREVMESYRDKLNKDYEPDTVFNKLMAVTSLLKRNPLAPTPAPLPVSEFPDKKETVPDPYTEQEFDAMMRVANYDEGLLLFSFAVTGLREQEMAHAEHEDIDWELGQLNIRKKAKYNWRGKNRSARRSVTLPPELLAEYALRGPGLLFPNPSTESWAEPSAYRRCGQWAGGSGSVSD